mgnify:CR=1 FL=1
MSATASRYEPQIRRRERQRCQLLNPCIHISSSASLRSSRTIDADSGAATRAALFMSYNQDDLLFVWLGLVICPCACCNTHEGFLFCLRSALAFRLIACAPGAIRAFSGPTAGASAGSGRHRLPRLATFPVFGSQGSRTRYGWRTGRAMIDASQNAPDLWRWSFDQRFEHAASSQSIVPHAPEQRRDYRLKGFCSGSRAWRNLAETA